MNVKLGKRAASLYFALCVMLLTIVFRLISIVSKGYTAVSEATSARSIEVASSRGCIYDKNYEPLVNTEYESYAALLPDSALLAQITASLGENEAARVSEAFGKGQMIISKTEHDFASDSAYSFRTVKRYGEDYVCAHIIGYTDSTGNDGVCGVEKAFDSLLDSFSGTLSLSFTQSGYETALPGCGFTVKNDGYLSSGGLVLTIDKKLQSFVEKTAEDFGIITGACVVLDLKDNSVAACASFPDFLPNAPGKSLSDENEPFINRALCAYPVGSVFKPFIAAAAAERGTKPPEKYNCTGSIAVGETVFNCYSSTAHGEIGMSEAIEKSCNCYFISLGLELGKASILGTAADFGFGKGIFLADGITASAGNLPDEADINSAPALANLCFGQGELTATPLQLAAAYAAFANGGYYKAPYILKQQIDGNGRAIAYYRPHEGERIISAASAAEVSEYLYNNIELGLGKNAKPENTDAAGKTATAQTGRYENGKEILDTWFAGYFPYKNPQYVIVIFKEKGSTASSDCAPMFKAVADYLYFNS